MVEMGDLFHVTVRGLLHSQRTITTYWYYAKGDFQDLGEVDAAETFAEQWNLLHGNQWALMLSNELLDLTLRVQLIRPNGTTKPTRWVYHEEPLTLDSGQNADGSLPATVAAVFRRRTARAGKQYRGRIYIPGIPVGFEENSKLSQVGYDALVQTHAAPLIQPLIIDTVQIAPCITDAPLHSRITEVTSALLDDVLRVQRRREVGVGE